MLCVYQQLFFCYNYLYALPLSFIILSFILIPIYEYG